MASGITYMHKKVIYDSIGHYIHVQSALVAQMEVRPTGD